MRVAVVIFLQILMMTWPFAAAETNPNTLSNKERAAGWQLLFDGTTFDGWRGYRLPSMPEAGWKIENGLLKTVPGVKGRELITGRTFNDFEFSWEWRIGPAGNNGIKYFVTEDRPAAPGHEYQMIDDERNEDGKVGPHRHKRPAECPRGCRHYDTLRQIHVRISRMVSRSRGWVRKRMGTLVQKQRTIGRKCARRPVS